MHFQLAPTENQTPNAAQQCLMHFCWLTRLISVRVTRKIGHNAFPAYFFINPQSGKIIILKHDVAISIEPAKVVPIGEDSRSGSERLHAGAFPLLAWMARKHGRPSCRERVCQYV